MTICAACKKKQQPSLLSRCARCRQVYYCNDKCQRAHWSIHKSECREYTPGPGGPLEIRSHRITAMGNGVYACREFQAWEEVLKEPSLVSFSYEDFKEFGELGMQPSLMLCSKLVQMQGFDPEWLPAYDFTQKLYPPGATAINLQYGNPSFATHVEKVTDIAHKHGKRWISTAYIYEALFPIVHNYARTCYEFMSGESIHYGSALYHYTSNVNHSCTPNCVALYRPDYVSLVALRDILPDEEITVCYRPAMDIQSIRSQNKAYLKLSFGPMCLCFHPNCLFRQDLKEGKESLAGVAYSATYESKWFDNVLDKYSLAAGAWLKTAKPSMIKSTPISCTDQIQWLIFALMKWGWVEMAKKMGITTEKLHDLLTEWVILTLPTSHGELKLRQAFLAMQLVPMSTVRRNTLKQLYAFMPHSLASTSQISDFPP